MHSSLQYAISPLAYPVFYSWIYAQPAKFPLPLQVRQLHGELICACVQVVNNRNKKRKKPAKQFLQQKFIDMLAEIKTQVGDPTRYFKSWITQSYVHLQMSRRPLRHEEKDTSKSSKIFSIFRVHPRINLPEYFEVARQFQSPLGNVIWKFHSFNKILLFHYLKIAFDLCIKKEKKNPKNEKTCVNSTILQNKCGFFYSLQYTVERSEAHGGKSCRKTKEYLLHQDL